MGQAWEADAGPLRVEFTNGAKIAAGFKAAPSAMKKELRASNTKTAKEAQRWIRSAAKSGTSAQARVANAIVGTGNSTQALIKVQPRAATAGALGTFFGALRYRQFPHWVGNSWAPADATGGPYVINPTLAAKKPEIETIHLQGQADALARALPR